MNFRKIAAASKGKLLLRYFTENTPEPIHPPGVEAAGRQLDEGGRLTAYYTGRDSRATWRPDMPAAFAAAVGIDPTRMPRDADMTRLFEGRRADTGEAWSKHPRKLSGFDLVFSPHKSVTLAAEFAATPAESAAIWNAMDRANDRAMRHVAEVLGWARKGAGGEDGADPGAVGWISFRHHAARPTLQIQDGAGGETYLIDAPIAGDPHAHIHNFLMNAVVTDDGRIGSLDTKNLTSIRVKEFGAYFQAVLADELRRLGAGVAYDAGKQAVVLTSIPEEASKAFSKRDQQILRSARRFAEAQGLGWDDLSADEKLKIVEEASAEGRLGKMKADERRIWREQADVLGWQHRTVMKEIAHPTRTASDRFEAAYAFAARELATEFHTAAVLSHEMLAMYAARGLIGAGIAGGSDDITRVVHLLEERGIRLKGEQVALVVGMFDGQVRVTNTAQIRIEEKLSATAQANSRDTSGALSSQAIGGAVAAAGISFTEEQMAAIYALGQGGALALLTGVAGAGKTTLLQPLVAAWSADTRFSADGRQVVGAATAWRQADALKDAGIKETYALQPLLKKIEAGEFKASRNTVLVLDEVSQIGPRPMLKLLEMQARTGLTIKMLGDREQAQAIEAGDTIELLRRALDKRALPELLSTIRQATQQGRAIAGMFRDANAADALALKRQDGTAWLVGGDRDQVVGAIADLYVQRRDVLAASGSKRGITVSAPTNDDAAEISQAIRARLKQRGEIGRDEVVYQAMDQRGQAYDLAIAAGDKLRLFRRTWGEVEGQRAQLGNNGDVVQVIRRAEDGLHVATPDGQVAMVKWRNLLDDATGRLMLGFGHALTIDAAQGITSDEHINALPRGTSGVTAFTSYVAESRSRGTTWTMISEAAVHEAERRRKALGDVTPITTNSLWARAAEDMSTKRYKMLGSDLLAAARDGQAKAVAGFIDSQHGMEAAQQDHPQAGQCVVKHYQAQAITQSLGRQLQSLDHAIRENGALLREATQAQEVARHLQTLRANAAMAKVDMDAVAPTQPRVPASSNGPRV